MVTQSWAASDGVRRRPSTARPAQQRRLQPEDRLHLHGAPLPSYQRYTMERERDEFLRSRSRFESVSLGTKDESPKDRASASSQWMARITEKEAGRLQSASQIRDGKHGGRKYFFGRRGVVRVECPEKCLKLNPALKPPDGKPRGQEETRSEGSSMAKTTLTGGVCLALVVCASILDVRISAAAEFFHSTSSGGLPYNERIKGLNGPGHRCGWAFTRSDRTPTC